MEEKKKECNKTDIMDNRKHVRAIVLYFWKRALRLELIQGVCYCLLHRLFFILIIIHIHELRGLDVCESLMQMILWMNFSFSCFPIPGRKVLLDWNMNNFYPRIIYFRIIAIR